MEKRAEQTENVDCVVEEKKYFKYWALEKAFGSEAKTHTKSEHDSKERLDYTRAPQQLLSHTTP